MSVIKEFVLFVNNYCNLHCELCTALCNLPFSKDSKWLDRRSKWEVNLDEVSLFCERFKGVDEHKSLILTGGEVTALPTKKLKDLIDILHRYNRKTVLLTNGFNVLGIGKPHLNKISQITLNDHGINHGHIMKCKKYLKTFYKGHIRHSFQKDHWDLDATRKLKRNIGVMCHHRNTMRSRVEIIIRNYVVYPCCALTGIETYNNDMKMSEELRKAGWTLKNPDLLETIRNFKETIPDYVKDQCLNHCWWPHKRVLPKVRITRNRNDVIRKP